MNVKKTIGLVVLVAAVFAVGFFARPEYDSYHQHQVKVAAKDFVGDLVAGNNAGAYALASSNVKTKQTVDQFSTSMGDLKSSSPQYSNEGVAIGKTSASYVVTVNNLPADGVGSTNGTFQLGLIKQNGKWVVDSVNVQ